jgi:Leucine-rich repeat (LRR) protein
MNQLLVVLALLSFSKFVISQTTNVSCSKDTLRYNPSSCMIRDTNIPDVNNINFIDFKPSMTSLSFTGGIMDSIPPNVLKIGNITIFSMSNTLIKTVKADDFQNGQFLKTFYLSNYSFTQLQANLFQYAPNIGTLTFYTGNLSSIDVKAFSELRKLTTLTLSLCGIKSLSVGIFDDLVSVTTIRMENNLLRELPLGLFDKTLNLTNLQISNNFLTSIPPKLLLHNSLTQFGARYNLLESVSTVRALTADFTDNFLKKVTISRVTTDALLNNNNISKLNCAKGLSIRTLGLSNNSLTSLRCIRAMKNLTYLDISRNKFKVLGRKGFKNLVNLYQLNTQDNSNLKFLRPVAFTNSKNLQIITCDDLVRYDTLKTIYPKLWWLTISTKMWNCTKLDNVTAILKNQSIYTVSIGCQN